MLSGIDGCPEREPTETKENTMAISIRVDAVPTDAVLTASVSNGTLQVMVTAAPGRLNAVGWLVQPPGWPSPTVHMDMDGDDGGREEADQRLFPEFNRLPPWRQTQAGWEATVLVRTHQDQTTGAPSHREEYV